MGQLNPGHQRALRLERLKIVITLWIHQLLINLLLQTDISVWQQNSIMNEQFFICSLTQRGRFAPRCTDPPLFLFAKETANGWLNAFLFAGFVKGILASSGDAISREARRTKKGKDKTKQSVRNGFFSQINSFMSKPPGGYLRNSRWSSRPAPGWVCVIRSNRRARGTEGPESIRASALHSSPSLLFCRVEECKSWVHLHWVLAKLSSF